MTNPRPDSIGPRIDIHLGPGGAIDIQQRRPAIARALVGQPVSVALERIPALLPICGKAQAVAAARAVAAALGAAQQTQTHSANCLLQEQALACGWRLSVDWPDLLGEPRQMAALKQLYQAQDDQQRSAALGQLIDGLDTAGDLDDLLGWARDSTSLAARVIRLAQTAAAAGKKVAAPPLDESGLHAKACAALAGAAFDPLDPAGSPLEVGPLAMGRNPLARELLDSMGSTVLSRLLAQLLDTGFIARTLLDQQAEQKPADTAQGAWALPGIDGAHGGVGCAVTARGPVFHQVRLSAGDDTVADWRVLAPTDWHFGRRGPVARELASIVAPTREQLALLVASYDPCAPWSLHTAGTAAQHA